MRVLHGTVDSWLDVEGVRRQVGRWSDMVTIEVRELIRTNEFDERLTRFDFTISASNLDEATEIFGRLDSVRGGVGAEAVTLEGEPFPRF